MRRLRRPELLTAAWRVPHTAPVRSGARKVVFSVGVRGSVKTGGDAAAGVHDGDEEVREIHEHHTNLEVREVLEEDARRQGFGAKRGQEGLCQVWIDAGPSRREGGRCGEEAEGNEGRGASDQEAFREQNDDEEHHRTIDRQARRDQHEAIEVRKRRDGDRSRGHARCVGDRATHRRACLSPVVRARRGRDLELARGRAAGRHRTRLVALTVSGAIPGLRRPACLLAGPAGELGRNPRRLERRRRSPRRRRIARMP